MISVMPLLTLFFFIGRGCGESMTSFYLYSLVWTKGWIIVIIKRENEKNNKTSKGMNINGDYFIRRCKSTR